MVSTRIQDGSISTRSYTPLALAMTMTDLSLNSPTISSPTRNRNLRSNPSTPTTPTKVMKPTSPRQGKQVNRTAGQRNASIGSQQMNTRERRTSILTGKMPTRARAKSLGKSPGVNTARGFESGKSPKSVRFSEPAENLAMGEMGASTGLGEAQDTLTDWSDGNTFFPSVIIGAKETTGLSRIGRADRKVGEWERILAEHEQKMPELADVVRLQLEMAKAERAKIDETVAENFQVGDSTPAATAIRTRIAALNWGLSTSHFDPEKENISCAIHGYQNGLIGYSPHFTLIYTGQIVDTCTQYSEFVRDRNKRLDRYFAQYGPGWLWYESPLDVHPESKPTMMGSVGLSRQEDGSNLGAYHVNEGFWKRSGYVSRMHTANITKPVPHDDQFFRNPEDNSQVYCQERGPRLSFRTLLDSGATYPSLFTSDLGALGIDCHWYAAQSIESCSTSTGPVDLRLYELWVCVLDNEGRHLINPNDAVFPFSHKFIGGLCPVTENATPVQYDHEGREVGIRLSGLLPFISCYVSSCPTRDILWLGEDRNDVLGNHRIPGQKKWTIEMQTIKPGLPLDRYDNPKIKFVHRGGKIEDEDMEELNHGSKITFLKGTPQETIVISHPSSRQYVDMMMKTGELPPGLASNDEDDQGAGIAPGQATAPSDNTQPGHDPMIH